MIVNHWIFELRIFLFTNCLEQWEIDIRHMYLLDYTDKESENLKHQRERDVQGQNTTWSISLKISSGSRIMKKKKMKSIDCENTHKKEKKRKIFKDKSWLDPPIKNMTWRRYICGQAKNL